MYFELFDIFLLSLVCAAIYIWLQTQKVREVALKAARGECERHKLQLLDGNVNLKKFKPQRNQYGSLCLLREYHFEFSATGDERYIGKVIMLGLSIDRFYLPPHRIIED